MKRIVPVVLILILIVCALAALSCPVSDPEEIRGTWYKEGEAYIFDEGIIRHPDGEFRGAYCFARSRVLLFLSEEETGTIRELVLVRSPKGNSLREKFSGKAPAIFSRQPSA